MPFTIQILEHTADTGFEVEGDTKENVIAGAVTALVSMITDETSIQESIERTVHTEGDDWAQAIVRYLNEVLYMIDGDGFLPARAVVEIPSSFTIDSTLYGEERSSDHMQRNDVKAITYHQILFTEAGAGFRLRVFVDI